MIETKGKHMLEDYDKNDSGLFVMPDGPNYLIPDNVYNVLKWVALILLPALAVFIGTVGPEWNMPYVNQIVITLNAIGVLIGTCIGVSQISANR